ncbi:hypothetical protein B0H67DRAFT_598204 [Lasiosphaeris hirsuta]|uniref:Uncharacterized protein n=1 Tax=Lasiosphaeris hirsuta TaxID=260670 RepID=A0AA40AZB3_9PEZI|nr:hypothetical protein B0H67DRAFT_598204 [Lasiosphaeris hirsuta]
MPYDKPPANSSRLPTMPVSRGINKPPLTPKVASRASTPQHQNPPVATPLARRGPRPDLGPSSNGVVPRDREEVVSPVSAFISNNITPRSGSRQVRVDSANTTPNGTPVTERQDLWETRSSIGGPSPAAEEALRRPMVTFSPAADTPSGARQDLDSKFFYASEAQKPVQQSVPNRQPTTLQKSATFFYANGATIPPRDSPANLPITPVLAVPAPVQESLMSKFVYANGIPDLPTSTKPATPQVAAPSSVVSTSSKAPSNRTGGGVSHVPYTSPRPSSPVKLLPFPGVKAGGSTNPPSSRSPISTTNPLGGLPSQRRPGLGHARSGSLTSNLTIAEPPAVARILSAHSSLPSSENSSPSNVSATPFGTQPANPATTGFASLLQAAEDLGDEDEAKIESLSSPTKSPPPEKELTDLVASARRERKVQDLEITNASLEAINRTLERQLRKQTAEIRRFRRLSRSGRLSMNSAGSRVVSDSTVEGGALARAGMGLDDLSEEESDDDAEDDEEDDMSSSDTSEENAGVVALRDARHRQKDERRLQLDLSKHQQLLVDSQKINQSLKRCLGWTEELIKEGKRALEYQVRVSEVDIGGRVLAPEDIEAREARALEGGDEDDGYEASLNAAMLGFEGKLPTDAIPQPSHPWSKDPQDRDSGIELPADGG